MKKLFFFSMFAAAMLASCTSSEDDFALVDNTKPSEVMIYSGGNQLGFSRAWSKTEELGYSIPKDGLYDVWYYIRIDGNIPGEDVTNLPSDQYFPQSSTGKTLVSDLNHGTVNANVEWKTCVKKNFPKYIFSTDGSAVESIIVDAPTLDDLFDANQSTKYNLQGYIEHKDELHFIWYACKQQGSDHIWHVDGILTSKDRKDISDTQYGPKQIEDYENAGMQKDSGDVNRKAHVEIDVHQQEHKDWNEIKTSIHLRDTVAVEVFLPIDYQEQADDFDIRAGQDFKYITEVRNTKITIGEKEYELKVNITHEEKGIRINIEPNKEALEAARLAYADGITYEVHSYVTPGVPTATIWEKLKKTTYSVEPYTNVFGQITSAYYPEDGIKL